MITTGIVISNNGFGGINASLGTLAVLPAAEFSMIKIVVVAAVFLGAATPARISSGAKYTPPPMPVNPATIPTMVPVKIFNGILNFTVRKGDVAIMTDN